MVVVFCRGNGEQGNHWSEALSVLSREKMSGFVKVFVQCAASTMPGNDNG